MERVELAIIGAGFSGLGLGIRAKMSGIDDFLIFEKNEDVGGTWLENSYPGCQCDVPSHLYSYSFAPSPDWDRTYSMQGQIHGYLRACADKWELWPKLRLGHQVVAARWDQRSCRWELDTDKGSVSARVLVSAHGGLSEPSVPEIKGIDRFEGKLIHSARWDHSFDLRGKRVAVVGTGASAIQIIPKIQPVVEGLTVFQRTPPWVLPHTDRAVSVLERRVFRRLPVVQRMIRAGVYLGREMLVIGMAKWPKALTLLRGLALRHLRKQVPDPLLRKSLTPTFIPGCKRLLLSNDYYPAVAAPNCRLVIDPIAAFTPRGIRTADGTELDFDAVIMATGFRVTDHPMTGSIFGIDKRSLAEHWSQMGMRAHRGTVIDGFPNMFLMTGPNTGIGHTSLLLMIEAQIGYIIEALRRMKTDGVDRFEVRPQVVEGYSAMIQRKMARTVWVSGGCVSWYLDSQGNNPTLWPDFTWRYAKMMRRFDQESYVTSRDRASAGR